MPVAEAIATTEAAHAMTMFLGGFCTARIRVPSSRGITPHPPPEAIFSLTAVGAGGAVRAAACEDARRLDRIAFLDDPLSRRRERETQLPLALLDLLLARVSVCVQHSGTLLVVGVHGLAERLDQSALLEPQAPLQGAQAHDFSP